MASHPYIIPTFRDILDEVAPGNIVRELLEDDPEQIKEFERYLITEYGIRGGMVKSGASAIACNTTANQVVRISVGSNHPDIAQMGEDEMRIETERFDHPMILQPLLTDEWHGFRIEVMPLVEQGYQMLGKTREEAVHDIRLLETRLYEEGIYFWDNRDPDVRVRMGGTKASYNCTEPYVYGFSGIGWLADGEPVVLDLGGVASRERCEQIFRSWTQQEQRYYHQPPFNLGDLEAAIVNDRDLLPPGYGAHYDYSTAQQRHYAAYHLEPGTFLGAILPEVLATLDHQHHVDRWLVALVEKYGLYESAMKSVIKPVLEEVNQAIREKEVPPEEFFAEVERRVEERVLQHVFPPSQITGAEVSPIPHQGREGRDDR